MPPQRPPLTPLDVRVAPVVLVGTALWAVALVVLLVAGGSAQWRWTCVVGIALGGFGLFVARRRGG